MQFARVRINDSQHRHVWQPAVDGARCVCGAYQDTAELLRQANHWRGTAGLLRERLTARECEIVELRAEKMSRDAVEGKG